MAALIGFVHFLALQDFTMDLDDRVTTLEESGGNSSVAELEERVEALEITVEDQEIRLTAAEENIQGVTIHSQ